MLQIALPNPEPADHMKTKQRSSKGLQSSKRQHGGMAQCMPLESRTFTCSWRYDYIMERECRPPHMGHFLGSMLWGCYRKKMKEESRVGIPSSIAVVPTGSFRAFLTKHM